MNCEQILELTIYFLAVLNPVSKIMFLTSYEPALNRREIMSLAFKSSVAALIMLEIFALAGNFLLQNVFRIELYSLRVTGGLVVFIIGWMAIREGRFFQKQDSELRKDFTELSIVPLAAPLIAGPGTITIAISFSAQYGNLLCFTIMFSAILVNFVLMMFSLPINRILKMLHLSGPLIRITGLVVAAVAVQMIFTGLSEWIVRLRG